MAKQPTKKASSKDAYQTISKSQNYVEKREQEMHGKLAEFFDEVRREMRQPLAELAIKQDEIDRLNKELAALKKAKR